MAAARRAAAPRGPDVAAGGGTAVLATGEPLLQDDASRPEWRAFCFVDLLLRRPGTRTLGDLLLLLETVRETFTTSALHFSVVTDSLFLALFVALKGDADDRQFVWDWFDRPASVALVVPCASTTRSPGPHTMTP